MIWFLEELKKLKVNYTINGSNRISGILNITFYDILSQDLVIALDMKGYAISGGAACSSGSLKTSTALTEINMDNEDASKTVRISFGKNITEENIIGLSSCIANVINKQHQNRVDDVK